MILSDTFDTIKGFLPRKITAASSTVSLAKLNRTALHCASERKCDFSEEKESFIINLNLEFVITMNLIRKKEIETAHAKNRTYE